MSTRSHDGCWTCKKGKRKCDRERPACQACQKRGIDCEGYGLRLRWGAGIASRGHFTGADKPVKSSIPPRPKGRRRDLSRERKRVQLEAQLNQQSYNSDSATMTEDVSPISDEWLPPLDVQVELPQGLPFQRQHKERLLFQECEDILTTGIHILHATTINEFPLVPAILQLCQESEALYQICLALQCYTSPTLEADFLEHYNDGLKIFRSELSASSTGLTDSNLISGLFLCTIELMRGTPWTVHLEGMYRIQQYQDFHGDADVRMHLMEVMGVMDMPVFVIGRQTPYFGVWRRHRRGMLENTTISIDKYSVEAVSGLPYSLLDLYAGIGEDTTDIDLWNWPGEKGSLLQCQLWESHRLAGMLSVRRFQRRTRKKSADIVLNQQQHLPDNEILVLRILSCIEAIVTAYALSERSGFPVINAISYPIFTIGLEVEVLRRNLQHKDLIRHYLQVSEKANFGVNQTLQSLLDDLWDIDELDLDVNDLARSRGLETALF